MAGGYTLITAGALLAAWRAYKQGTIQLADLRAWFACCELIAQRRASGTKSRFRPGMTQIAHLTGSSESATRARVRRLVKAGILAMHEAGPAIPDTSTTPLATGDSHFHRAPSQTTHHSRRVPVPRRMLRLLARSTRPVFIATVLGHFLRCLFLKSGCIAPAGLCKAAWIAYVFNVDERNVKTARRELINRGWLLVDAASQRFLNRWGLPVRVNLDWIDVTLDMPATRSPVRLSESPPRKSSNALESPPPLKNRNRLQRSSNHVPAPTGGVCRPQLQSGTTPLRNVRIEDLRSESRLRMLFAGTVQAGLLQRCAADELRFVSAAERALSLGTSNPPGFFATIVRRRLWHVISQRDEDAARGRLVRRFDAPLAGDAHPGRSRHKHPQRPIHSRPPTRAGTVANLLIAPLAEAVNGMSSSQGRSGG